MNWQSKFLFLFFSFLLWTSPVAAETLSGVVRNVNHSSRSFGLDVPPLTRVYITGGTRFERSSAAVNFKMMREGDKVEVEGRSGGPGVFMAARVNILGNIAPVKDLAGNEILISADQTFLLGVNQTAVLKEDGKVKLKLSSTEFINTLCKGGYDCSAEGEVGMRLKVSQGSKENEVILSAKNHRKPIQPVQVEIFGYAIQLVEAGEDVVLLVVRKP